MAGGVGSSSPIQLRKHNQFGADTSPQNAYAQSIPQQAGDYDTIMGGYKKIVDQGGAGYDDLISRYQGFLDSPDSEFKPAQYQEAPEFAEAYGLQRDLARTGGLSDTDQANLRERGISPIRSVYANAQRNLDRNKSLQGGYSANYGAASSKMAREMSESVAGATTNVNAKIAEMVQAGKLKATPELGALASGKNNLMNEMNMANSANALKAQQTKQSSLQGYGDVLGQRNADPLKALSGMTNLYGTTPALVNTFGNQVQNQQQMGMQAQQNKNNFKYQTINAMRR